MPFKPGFHAPKTGIRFKPSSSLLAALNSNDSSHSINRNRSKNTVGGTMLGDGRRIRTASAAALKKQKEAAEHEAYRKRLREQILKHGIEYSQWPGVQNQIPKAEEKE